jgi:Domain of unknown function (DUF397)
MGEGTEERWRRPDRCANESTCVEVAFVEERVLVRNSQAPDGPVTTFDRDEWATFVAAVKRDEFDG